jgi:hypothetical protein
VGNLRERGHLEYLDRDGRWRVRKWVRAWTELIWLRIEKVEDTFECVNGPSGSIKCKELVE